MTAREVLDGIKARLAAATPGPWRTEPVESGSFAHIESRVYSLRGSHILLSPAGEQIWFKSRFEAEQTILPVEDGGCCELVPVADDYDGPKWVPEEWEEQ